MPADETRDAAPGSADRVQRLEHELRLTRENLAVTIEELGTSNEALTALNEELRAANERQESINRALEISQQALRAANGELTKANSDLKNLLESTQIATILLDESRCVRSFTAAATDVFYLVPADVGRPIRHVRSRVTYPELEDDIDQVLRTLATVEREIGPPEGPRFHVRVLPYRTLENRIAGTVLTLLDITEAARSQAELMAAEAALRQAQKMEAIGQLTGGIAHDFNNMLQSIAGSLELARRRVAQGRAAEAGRFLEAARRAVERGAALTHRLLAVARRQQLQPRAVAADALVEGVAELVRRTVGPAIRVELRLRDGGWLMLCDPNQLESALLNLAVNARDAMPEGGRFAIATRPVHLSAAEVAGQNGAAPGEYVEVTVSDTGTGMDEATRARAFEPFFTTKPLGQGTGLGLSQVYGFVRQSGGLMRLDSAPGWGTTVRLYLPRNAGVEWGGGEAVEETRLGRAGGAAPSAQPANPGAGETVLLVEDDADVHQTLAQRLREVGYRVLEAKNGATALPLLRSGACVDLLVTDVGLPGGLNGRQVAEMVRERRPGLPVLFITGYAGDELDGHLAPGAVVGKHFDVEMMVERVRAMLTAKGRPL